MDMNPSKLLEIVETRKPGFLGVGSCSPWGHKESNMTATEQQKSLFKMYVGRSKSISSSTQFRRPGFDPWVGKILWRREWLPTPVFWPGEFHGLYSLWGCNESDTTEWLSHIHPHPEEALLWAAHRAEGCSKDPRPSPKAVEMGRVIGIH